MSGRSVEFHKVVVISVLQSAQLKLRVEFVDRQVRDVSHVSKLYVVLDQVHGKLKSIQEKVYFFLRGATRINYLIADSSLDIE